jgi:hypothetical protein
MWFLSLVVMKQSYLTPHLVADASADAGRLRGVWRLRDS